MCVQLTESEDGLDCLSPFIPFTPQRGARPTYNGFAITSFTSPRGGQALQALRCILLAGQPSGQRLLRPG